LRRIGEEAVSISGQSKRAVGRKGGESPTRGKKAVTYVVTLPDGSQHKKRVLVAHDVRDHIATAFRDDGGNIHVQVWVRGVVPETAEGDLGRLVAKPERRFLRRRPS
jgi:hypothetical protein